MLSAWRNRRRETWNSAQQFCRIEPARSSPVRRRSPFNWEVAPELTIHLDAPEAGSKRSGGGPVQLLPWWLLGTVEARRAVQKTVQLAPQPPQLLVQRRDGG